MTKMQWMWLWIWLLIFLIIFCIFDKINSLNQQQRLSIINNIEKNSSLTISKTANKVKISGYLNSKNEAISIIKEYKLFAENLKENIEISNNFNKLKCFKIVQNLAYHFLTNFEYGKIECKNGSFYISGLLFSEIAKKRTNEIIQNYNIHNLKIVNNMKIEKPTTKKTKANKELYELLDSKVIEFIKSKDIITEDSKAILDEVAQILKKYKGLKIQIQGHTDSDGDEKFNQALSEARAIAVKNYLIQKGIDAKTLFTKGFGQSRPRVKNDSKMNKQKNRRVEFKIIGE